VQIKYKYLHIVYTVCHFCWKCFEKRSAKCQLHSQVNYYAALSFQDALLVTPHPSVCPSVCPVPNINSTRSSAVAQRPRDAWCHWIFH